MLIVGLLYVYLIDFFNFQPLKIILTCPYNEVPLTHHFYMSLVVRKPDFCICEIKDVDELRGNCEADQHLCFRYTDSTIPLLPKSDISSLYSSSVAVQPGLCRTWSETPKTGFRTTRRNGNMSYVVQNERYASSGDFVVMFFARESIVSIISPFF